MMRLLSVEVRRYAARRLVHVLVLLAVAIVLVVTVAVYAANDPITFTPAVPPTDDPRFLTALWPEGSESEGYLMIPAVMLSLFAFVAGASMTGAEWRAGTMTTVLTWEPRRVPLLVAKLAAAGLLATAIAAALTALFAAAFLPTVLAHGTTLGADSSWWLNLAGGWLRIAGMAGLMATVGTALASLGRNTAGAVAVGLGWLMVGEGIVRGLHPQWNQWLVGENIAAVVTGGLGDGDLTRSALAGGLTLAVYALGVSTLAAATFRRRDVAGGS